MPAEALACFDKHREASWSVERAAPRTGRQTEEHMFKPSCARASIASVTVPISHLFPEVNAKVIVFSTLGLI